MTKPSTSPWGLSTKRSKVPAVSGRLSGSIQCIVVTLPVDAKRDLAAGRRRRRTEARGRRRGTTTIRAVLRSGRARAAHLRHLLRRGADRTHVDYLAEGGIEYVAAHRDVSALSELVLHALGLRGWQAQRGAVIKHDAVHLAALAVQLQGDAA